MLDAPPPARSRFDADLPMPSPPRRDVAREVSACASALSVQLATALAENVNVKSVHRKLSSFSRMLITITFAEDAWRMVSDYAVQVRTMDELVEHGTNLVPAPLTRAMPAVSAALQIYGVAAVVTERQPTRGAAVLLCWCVLHPFVYGQGSNILFLAETVTVTGGLLILLAHWRQGQQREVARASNGADHRTAELGDDTLTSVLHLAGRVCVSCYFVVYGLLKLQSTLSGTRTVLSLPVGLVHGCLMVVLCYMSLLLIVGSKSRRVALLLSAIMFATNLYWHPFWMRLGDGASSELAHSQRHLNIVLNGVGGEQAGQGGAAARAASAFDQRGKPLPLALRGLAALGQAAKPRLAMQISVFDHERYFFFQRLSTVGALLLLAVHGPGRVSVDSEASGTVSLSKLMHVVKGND